MAGFKEGFTKAGGQIVGELLVPFPEVEFQSFLTQIAEKKPDARVHVLRRRGCGKVREGLRSRGPAEIGAALWTGFLTDGTLQAQGEAAEGLKTTLHYADDLDNPADKAFRAAYQKRYSAEPDVYSVQGYDAAALL